MTRQELIARVRAGEPLEAIAKLLGVSRERVRQKTNELDPGAIPEGQLVRQLARLEQQRVAAEVRMVVTALRLGPCMVCQGPVTRIRPNRWGSRKEGRTCSRRCAALWPHARLVLSEEHYQRHRETAARWVLSSPHADPRFLGSARRVQAGLPPNRRYQHPGSKSAQAVAEALRLRAVVAARGESWWT